MRASPRDVGARFDCNSSLFAPQHTVTSPYPRRSPPNIDYDRWQPKGTFPWQGDVPSTPLTYTDSPLRSWGTSANHRF
jgi:hypothetical protein